MRGAIVEAGRDFGLRQVGSRARDQHARVRLDPCPLPAVFTGDDLKAYREWPSPTATRERAARRQLLRGRHLRLLPDAARPRYWPFVKFDHDFVGREALEAIADEPRRKKVTLAWNGEDVARAIGTLFEKGDPEVASTSRSNYARPGRTTSCCTTARRSVSRPSPATATTSARTSPWGWSTSTSSSAPR